MDTSNKKRPKLEIVMKALILVVLLPATMLVESIKVVWFAVKHWDDPLALLDVIADNKLICENDGLNDDA